MEGESCGVASSAAIVPPMLWKYGWLRASSLVGLSAGSMERTCCMKWSDLLESVPMYFFCRVSGRDISGNFNPAKRLLARKRSVWAGIKGPTIFWMM